MLTLKFAETHNSVAFLEKLEESNGFEEIIDFLNASSVQYALTVNPTIYTTCIEQFWTSTKLDDAEGTNCLPTATIFAELERICCYLLRFHHSTSIHTQPSSSKPQKKKSRRKQRKDSGPTEPIPNEAINDEHVATPSCDLPQSGEDRMQLTELMDLCTQLQ
ncbi:hypothetical protein Tco_1111573 [Tanacetum coccineum]|uniref:Uncharacterized protein n=1 Tax=Tanacetum coccineum TaxID=301880 RepID=A0ABQ5INH5_9ASTR